jgi:hypothetical protein
VIYRISFGIGGPGYAVPFALLAAGISIPAALSKLLPNWVVILGLFVAAVGVLSWFEILSVRLLPLIPSRVFPASCGSSLLASRSVSARREASVVTAAADVRVLRNPPTIVLVFDLLYGGTVVRGNWGNVCHQRCISPWVQLNEVAVG